MVKRFNPYPARAGARDREAENWAIRQFRDIAQALKELMNLVFSVNVASLADPLTVTEAEGEVEVLTLEATFTKGVYVASVSFISDFQQANDEIEFGMILDGNEPLNYFSKVAQKASESIPFSFSLPLDLEGYHTFTLVAAITGPGQADVVITQAYIFTERWT